MIIKQGTNYTRTFLMVQSADHITGITSGTPAVSISKAGGAFAAAANSPATFVGNGLCSIALTIVDTNTPGELAFHCSLAAADPTDFIDQVQPQVFTDLQLDPTTGAVGVTSNIKKNQARPGFMFVMTAGSPGTPAPSLTVSGFFILDGGSFSALGPVVELANGWYKTDLLASHTNGNNVGYRFIAAGANDLNMGFLTQP